MPVKSLSSYLSLTLAAAALTACAAEHPTTAPAVAPPAGSSSSSHLIKLADAVPLKELTTDDREANLTDKLSKPQAAETVYFGELDTFADPDDDKPDTAVPIIATKHDGDWSAVPLGGDGLRNAGWRYVGAGPRPHEIWGALDTVAGDTRTKFVLAHSTDGGATFELATFTKPCKLATFFDFAMDRDGHGRASVSLDADCGEHKAGLYHYETTDDGKTWSREPRYEPDAMIRADDVPDDEQPDAPPDGARRTGFEAFKVPHVHAGLQSHVQPIVTIRK